MAAYNTSQVPQVLTFRPSPDGQKVTLIQREGYNDTTPLYTLTTSKTTKLNFQLCRVVATSTGLQQTVVGSASFYGLSSSVELNLHGQCIKMKPGTLSGNQKFTYPPTGEMKWKSSFVGSTYELFDSSADRKLARYKLKFSGSGGKRLELLVPCDDYFLDLIVLSGVAAAAKDQQSAIDASKIASAVSG